MSRSSPEELLERFCAGPDAPDPAPAVVVVAAHPDDEVIGAGARLPQLRTAWFLHVTDGSPANLSDALAAGCPTREEYARQRRRELHAALALAGIDSQQTLALGLDDQEVSWHLPALVNTLAEVLNRLRPEVVLTHPYEGGHPDHDATALGVHAACRRLRRQAVPVPALVEMTSYHAGPEGMRVGEFLRAGSGKVITLVLSEAERAFKQRLFECYRSQRKVLSSFPTACERFRLAPCYDFTRAPHEGRLFYENFDWGMTGARWRSLAATCLEALGIAGPL